MATRMHYPPAYITEELKISEDTILVKTRKVKLDEEASGDRWVMRLAAQAGRIAISFDGYAEFFLDAEDALALSRALKGAAPKLMAAGENPFGSVRSITARKD